MRHHKHNICDTYIKLGESGACILDIVGLVCDLGKRAEQESECTYAWYTVKAI